MPENDQDVSKMNPRDREFPHEEENTISLLPLVSFLREYRNVILLLIGMITALYVVAACFIWVSAPKRSVTSIEFRLLFEGAQRGEYPNGLRFSPTEFVATPILSKVYERNQLSDYVTFNQFRESLVAHFSHPSLPLLEAEYMSKLDDTRLNIVERERLEREYQDKLAALGRSDVSLEMVLDHRFRTLPLALRSKILQDLLSVWAEHATRSKGAFKYRIDVLSTNIVSNESLTQGGHVRTFDFLRTKILQVVSSIDALATLPGAKVIRVSPEKVSLAELRENLVDTLHFELEPLTTAVTQAKAKNRDSVLYIESRLQQILWEVTKTTEQLKLLEDALRRYDDDRSGSLPSAKTGALPDTITQLSDSFLDRLIALSTQGGEAEFRQSLTERTIQTGLKKIDLESEREYYEDLLDTVKATRPTSNVTLMSQDEIDAKVSAILALLRKTLERVNEIYDILSSQNMDPSTELVTVTHPISTVTSPGISSRSLVQFGLVVVFASLLIVPAGLFGLRLLQITPARLRQLYSRT